MFIKNFFGLLKRFTASSILNVVGMAVAFATAYIIAVQVNYELSFNKSFVDAEHIVLLEWPNWLEDEQYQEYVSRPIGEAAFSNNSTVKSYGVVSLEAFDSDITYRVGDGFETARLKSPFAISVESFNILGIKPLRGDFSRCDDPKAVVLTESAAKILNRDVGGSICYGSTWKEENIHEIIAIIPDMPKNSYFADFQVIEFIRDNWINDFSEWSFAYIAKINTDSLNRVVEISKQNIEPLFQFDANDFADLDNLGEDEYQELCAQMDAYQQKLAKTLNSVKVVPITEMYFDEGLQSACKGNVTTTRMLIAIALLIIVIAFINFVNFFMAMVPQRLRGVNTYRVYGCTKTQMKMSFLFEAVGLVVLALAVSLLLIGAAESSFIADFVTTSISLSSHYMIFIAICVVALVFAFVANIYPAHYITSFPLAVAAKGGFVSSKAGKRLRVTLVGVQFVISIALIISSLFIKIQHDYMMSHDMGFNKELLITGDVPGNIGYYFDDREAFASELKKNPQIVDVAYSNGNIVAPNRMGWGHEHNGEEIHFECYPVSYNFLNFMGIDIIEGEDFSKAAESDSLGTFIFNEEAKNKFGLTLEDKIEGHNSPTRIVGFCKDFNFRPLQYGNAPFAFYVFGPNSWKTLNRLYVRLAPNADIEAVIDFIKDEIVKYDPDTKRGNLDFEFFDEELAANYLKEKKFAALITTFSVVSIIISLMGVFGLVLFETQYRRKEIALRRVNGATVGEILSMFSNQFVKIVTICFVIAAPIAYFIIDRWLERFAYRTPMHWWVFALSFAIVLIITISIVIVRCWRTANANPVEAIKEG